MFTPENLKALNVFAASLEMNAPASAMLLNDLAEEVEGNSPIARFLAEHPDASEPLFLVRVVACAQWLMLRGKAPELTMHLRKVLDNTNNPEYLHRTWELSKDAILGNRAESWEALSRPVQQHQPNRASHLLRGLTMLAIPSMRVELLELGACAGFNLLLDRYCWFGHDWQWGDPSSPVRIATTGPRPGNIEIVRRAGCDLYPRDPHSEADAKILHSYLPPEWEVCHMELDDALALAQQMQPTVQRADAADWLGRELDRPADEDVCTVVWHSLFWGLLDASSQQKIDEIMESAARRGRNLARVALEPRRPSLPPQLQVTLYS
ncbi:DUF2332 family protein [Mycobacterium marinum]|uniref:DUF2332 family protein n=1 Tax=Mycobacterium marinum TaxID=1781 RepID=UPI003562CBB8